MFTVLANSSVLQEDFGSGPASFLAFMDTSHLYFKVQFIREPVGSDSQS